MGPKRNLKNCPLFLSGSVTSSHRKSKGKKTKGATSVARTIVNCFPSAFNSSDSVTFSPHREPVRVPRNPIIRSTRRARPPCTQDSPPKKKRVIFRLPKVSSRKTTTVHTSGPSSSGSILPSTCVSSPSADDQASTSSPPLPFGQTFVFSRSSLPSNQVSASQAAESSKPSESLF